MVSLRKNHPEWLNIEAIQIAVTKSNSFTIFEYRFDLDKVDKKILKRAVIISRIESGAIPKSHKDYISLDEEKAYLQNLKENYKEKYCRYLLCKIYQNIYFYKKVKIKKMICTFMDSNLGPFFTDCKIIHIKPKYIYVAKLYPIFSGYGIKKNENYSKKFKSDNLNNINLIKDSDSYEENSFSKNIKHKEQNENNLNNLDNSDNLDNLNNLDSLDNIFKEKNNISISDNKLIDKDDEISDILEKDSIQTKRLINWVRQETKKIQLNKKIKENNFIKKKRKRITILNEEEKDIIQRIYNLKKKFNQENDNDDLLLEKAAILQCEEPSLRKYIIDANIMINNYKNSLENKKFKFEKKNQENFFLKKNEKQKKNLKKKIAQISKSNKKEKNNLSLSARKRYFKSPDKIRKDILQMKRKKKPYRFKELSADAKKNQTGFSIRKKFKSNSIIQRTLHELENDLKFEIDPKTSYKKESKNNFDLDTTNTCDITNYSKRLYWRSNKIIRSKLFKNKWEFSLSFKNNKNENNSKNDNINKNFNQINKNEDKIYDLKYLRLSQKIYGKRTNSAFPNRKFSIQPDFLEKKYASHLQKIIKNKRKKNGRSKSAMPMRRDNKMMKDIRKEWPTYQRRSYNRHAISNLIYYP